jgi:hypothetical protein
MLSVGTRGAGYFGPPGDSPAGYFGLATTCDKDASAA